MTTNSTNNLGTTTREDEGGGGARNCNDSDNSLLRSSEIKILGAEQQPVDIFVKHVNNQLNRELKDRRPSLPLDAIELPTLNGVVMRRKQQLQLRYQQQQQQIMAPTITRHSLSPTSNILSQQQQQQKAKSNSNRPLSISSISSAASSGSSSSATSSTSSGIQSSLTRNGSLNYDFEYRKGAYLASVESLNSTGQSYNSSRASSSENQAIEIALKKLNLHPSGQFKDAAARAAILAAGAQTRGFNNNNSNSNSNGNKGSNGNRISRINRSLHASLRYDKNTAYRIHMMANAKALLKNTKSTDDSQANNNSIKAVDNEQLPLCRGGSISRNNSSTSSDSGHNNQRALMNKSYLLLHNSRFICSCGASSDTSDTGSSPSIITSSSSSPQVNQASTSSLGKREINYNEETKNVSKNKAATLDSSGSSSVYYNDISDRRNSGNNVLIQHHPDCSYLKLLASTASSGFQRPKRASAKLHQSPSSASSHSNTSSLFRDDGFEDDLTSNNSEQSSTHYQHHRLSFQGRLTSQQSSYINYINSTNANNNSPQQQLQNYRHSRRLCGFNSNGQMDDDDEYQSCEEEFTNSNTTASTASNFDDCALSTTSSSIYIHSHEQQLIDKISLANAKQQYRKSLLIEHRQQQQQHQQPSGGSKIQALLTSSPKICGSPLLHNTSVNTSTTSSTTANSSPIRQSKCEDRTVNIIGHMPTRPPGYWDSNLSITQRVVTEIIETERTYVDDLEQIVTGYICYLRNVLKQQKHRLSQNNLVSQQDNSEQRKQQQLINEDANKTMVIDSEVVNNNNVDNRIVNDDDKLIIFDDDITSATNEVEDDDVEEADNDLSMKENPGKPSLGNTMNIGHQSKEEPLIDANNIKKLFSNLEDIYKFNKDLLFRLEECYLNPSSVAECFVENASGFEVYTHYCTMYPQVVSTLTELMGDPKSSQLLKERQSELNQSLPLGAYLLKPVQRILKYHILFQSLIKHTSDDESVNEKDRKLISEAFSVMTSIACHINAMKKRHEHAIRVQEVQGLLSGWEGPDLTTLGELILEDTFKLYNRPKSNRHLFLFDNVLLITKKKRDGSLSYKTHIACSNLMLIEKIEGQPLVFNTVPFDNPKALHAFQAKNLDKKRDWCLQMKEVIIKSFEVKIPIHAKDILMSLTNTCTNTADNQSPKSLSSETTRALKAPNYLERKRIKQDKKK